MNRTVPCVLMRAGTSRGPFFLREWLPADERARDEALIGAIGASDLLQLDGVGGGSTLTSKVAIVSPSDQPGCDVDYLFAQVGVGQRSVDTSPNCGNMLAGVGPFAIEQGLVPAADGTTTVRVYNVNTRSRIDVTVQTPGRRVTYAGAGRIDGVAGTAAPIRLNFLDAWGAVTGSIFPTGRRIDVIDGVEVTCLDAAMPLMIIRAGDLGVTGRESTDQLDADTTLLDRLESLRRKAGRLMGLGEVADKVIPKPVIVSAGDDEHSITSRYFTPRRCHASHAATGAIGVATAFALPGTVAADVNGAGGGGAGGGADLPAGTHDIAVLHPQGRIDVQVELAGAGDQVVVTQASLVRTARKILQGDLHLPDYVFSAAAPAAAPAHPGTAAVAPFPNRPITIIVPTSAGGANDAIARAIARRLGPRLGQTVAVDNRSGAHGSIASEYVARAQPDGHTLLLGYIATHGMNPALQTLAYDPVTDFAPVGLLGHSPTVLVTTADDPVTTVQELIARLDAEPDRYRYASAGDGTAPHFAAELFKLNARVEMAGLTHEGSTPALSDTVNGRTRVMFASLFSAQPWITSGRLRALAVAGPDRVPELPGVPTLRETGIDGVEVTQWYALFAPAATPSPVIDQLNAALNEVLADPESVRQIADHGVTVARGSTDQLATLVTSELSRWTSVVRLAKLTPTRRQAHELSPALTE
jgi:2-methylaconitate cis-trans-isomerase PrpF/tripartite-type tricarboxylate transporter receptor subunit TctC